MPIQSQEARGIYKSMLVETFAERLKPTGFLRSFFPEKIVNSKYIDVEVQRGTEKIAVDVERGSEGNRNKISKLSQKKYESLYYREYFEATDMDIYDVALNQSANDANVFSDFVEQSTDKLMACKDKIDRAYELLCANTLLHGIITTSSGDNIDFKRLSTSKVNLSASMIDSNKYWTASDSNPFKTFKAAGDFLRTKGKYSGGTINVVMGSQAFSTFLSNAEVQTRGDIRRHLLEAIAAPQRNAEGGAYHGTISEGSWNFNLWTYPQYYDTETTTNNAYIPENKVVFLPESPRFNFTYATVPSLIANGGIGRAQGSFVVGEFLDLRNTSHIFDIKSAGMPIPVAVDQIFTAQVEA